MNRFYNLSFVALSIIVLFFPSYIHADPPTLNIPPTNAIERFHTDNATVEAQNFSMPIILKGENGISITGNNATHTVFINGTNCTAITFNDESASRSIGTIYHNISGKTMYIAVSIQASQSVSGFGASGSGEIGKKSDLSDAVDVGDTGIPQISNLPAGMVLVTMGEITFFVPTNYYYEIFDNSTPPNSILLNTWIEYFDPSCGAKTTLTQGTYNQTLANNTPININGNRINFINGTGNPVHVENSNSGQQVNVTISSSGASGVTQLNGFTGKINLTRTYSNNTEIINDTGHLQISVKPNVVLTNGSAQIITKELKSNNIFTFFGEPSLARIISMTGARPIFSITNTNPTTSFIQLVPANDGNVYIQTGSTNATTSATNLIFSSVDAARKYFMINIGASNAVNFLTVTPTISGSPPFIQPSGTDTNIGVLLTTKGTGVIGLQSGTGTLRRVNVDPIGNTNNAQLTIHTNQTTSQNVNVPNLAQTGSFIMQMGNYTSDANALVNIVNHQCGTYFVTGNSTFRLICNFNGIAHVLGKQ